LKSLQSLLAQGKIFVLNSAKLILAPILLIMCIAAHLEAIGYDVSVKV